MENVQPAQPKPPQSPGAPLHPVSPDRFNKQKMNQVSTASPELSPLHNKGRNGPDIQSKVAYFSNLARMNSPTSVPHSVTTTAALQRAILGREEAEAALHATQEQLSEANARERRVSERLEALMEELQSLKARQAHERGIFEKEVRKARKEAFRAGSTLVKVQEELKYSRNQIKILKEDLKAARDAKEKANQEAFERAYALAGLTEEMEVMKERLRSLEAGSKTDTSEGKAEESKSETPSKKPSRFPEPRPSTPASRTRKRDKPDTVDQISPTRKRVLSGQNLLSPKIESPVKLQPSPTKRSCAATLHSESIYNDRAIIDALKAELRWERRLRIRAEDMVSFLKMECQFKRCSCRIAESDGIKYVHDVEWEMQYPSQPKSRPVSRSSGESRPSGHSPLVKTSEAREESQNTEEPGLEKLKEEEGHSMTDEQSSMIMTFNPDTGTFLKVPSPAKDAATAEVDYSEPNEGTPSQRARKRSSSPVPLRPEKRFSGDRDHFSSRASSQSIQMPSEECSNPQSLVPNLASETEAKENVAPAQQFFEKETTPATHYHEDTTTQRVPLADEKSRNNSFGPVPGTPISREEALAQIRARRDRTQNALKRSASANDASTRSRAGVPPLSGSRRIPRVENAELRSASVPRRDFSAPVGKLH
ncbi:hypothetical protein VTO42DRAFT_696 [Malbranchea cinnamomea]